MPEALAFFASHRLLWNLVGKSKFQQKPESTFAEIYFCRNLLLLKFTFAEIEDTKIGHYLLGSLAERTFAEIHFC